MGDEASSFHLRSSLLEAMAHGRPQRRSTLIEQIAPGTVSPAGLEASARRPPALPEGHVASSGLTWEYSRPSRHLEHAVDEMGPPGRASSPRISPATPSPSGGSEGISGSPPSRCGVVEAAVRP